METRKSGKATFLKTGSNFSPRDFSLREAGRTGFSGWCSSSSLIITRHCYTITIFLVNIKCVFSLVVILFCLFIRFFFPFFVETFFLFSFSIQVSISTILIFVWSINWLVQKCTNPLIIGLEIELFYTASKAIYTKMHLKIRQIESVFRIYRRTNWYLAFFLII